MFGGLIGLGSIIMIPLIVGVIKRDKHKANATSLVALVFTGISGTAAFGVKGSVDVLAALLLAATSMTTARAVAHYAQALPEWRLKRSFGVFLCLVSVLLLIKPYLPHIHGIEDRLAVCCGAASGWRVSRDSSPGMMGAGADGSSAVRPWYYLRVFSDVGAGNFLTRHGSARSVGRLGIGNRQCEDNHSGGTDTAGILVGTYLCGTLAHFLSEATLRIVFAAMLIWTSLRFFKDKETDVVSWLQRSNTPFYRMK